MSNILLISIAFPPKKDPECIQTAKYFKYLVKEKSFNITVLTSKSPTLNMSEDKSLAKYDVGYSQKIEIPIWENRYLNKINSIIGNPLNFLPDTKWAFHKKIDHKFNLIKNKPDFIYSRSFPISSSLAGYKAKKYFKAPWLMHLSDPWYLSPLHTYHGKERDYHKRQEIKLLNYADFISFTSYETIALYKKQYPKLKDKFLYFPNVYDKDDYSKTSVSFADKVKIVYTGGMVGSRSPQAIIDALKLINEEIKQNLEIIFIGETDRENRRIFNNCNEKCVSYIGAVPFDVAMQYQKESNILLLIDNNIEDFEKAIYFPSKLLDYMMARRKIMAITTLNGATHNALKRIGGVAFDHRDTKSISNFLVEAVAKFNYKDYDYFNNSILLDEFDVKFNTNRLIQQIKKLLTEQV